MKDKFSPHSQQYLQFRPGYPHEMYDFLSGFVANKNIAWDCGTGNGQVARELAGYFNTVYATDMSEKQIKNAFPATNIIYKVEAAEKTDFPDNYFDLVTVAQAIHWFDFEAFYKEVGRTIKQGGIFAVIGYGLIQISNGLDKIIADFYQQIIGPYWDKERKYIDENYQTIPFPFKEIQSPVLYNELQWTFDQLIGYIETWSAVQNYIKANNTNPIHLIDEKLRTAWKAGEIKKIRFPILLRIARIEK